MDLKEFFRPNRKKIMFSFLLIGTSILLTLIFLALAMLLMSFSFALSVPFYLLSSSILSLAFGAHIFFLIFSLLLAYVFGCYYNQNERRMKAIFLYLAAFVLTAIALYFLIFAYNSLFGHLCTKDSDCRFVCGQGSVNKAYISLDDPFIIVDCFQSADLCEENRCTSISLDDVNSTETCARISKDYIRWNCYEMMVLKFNDSAICDSISEPEGRYACYRADNEYRYNRISERITFGLCNNMSDKWQRESCFDDVVDAGFPEVDTTEQCDEMIKEYHALDEMTQEYFDLQNCYHHVALNTNYSAACSKIMDSGIKDSCYLDLAMELEDANICFGADDFERCYQHVVFKSRDDSDVCHNLINDTVRDTCYWTFSVNHLNNQSCEKITVDWERNDCYESIKENAYAKYTNSKP